MVATSAGHPRSQLCFVSVEARWAPHLGVEGVVPRAGLSPGSTDACRSPASRTEGALRPPRRPLRGFYPVSVSTLLAVVLVPLHATPDDQPPPFTALRLLTEWNLDWWLVVGLAIPAMPVRGGSGHVTAPGDRWPLRRSVAFFGGGLGTAALATLSGLGAYDTVLFSVHVVQHMILMMVTPMFMALGAPVTLALRTLPRRPRTVLLSLLHSRLARVLTFAPLALALFIATPFALVLLLVLRTLAPVSVLARVLARALRDHRLAADVAVDRDRSDPGADELPIRLLVLFLMLPFHAFLGISIMSSTTLIAEDWYLAFNRTWPPSPLDDQYLAGAIMWGSGDFTAVLMLGALFVQWFAHSQREARRVDRRLDRLEAAQLKRETTTPLDEQACRAGRTPSNPPKGCVKQGGTTPLEPPERAVIKQGGTTPLEPPEKGCVQARGDDPPRTPRKGCVQARGDDPPGPPERAVFEQQGRPPLDPPNKLGIDVTIGPVSPAVSQSGDEQ